MEPLFERRGPVENLEARGRSVDLAKDRHAIASCACALRGFLRLGSSSAAERAAASAAAANHYHQ